MNPERENKVVGDPVMGNSSDYATTPSLDAKSPVQMSKPAIGTSYAWDGITKSASTTGPTGVVETTASTVNESAKYKYPNVSQDTVPEDLVAKAGSSI